MIPLGKIHEVNQTNGARNGLDQTTRFGPLVYVRKGPKDCSLQLQNYN